MNMGAVSKTRTREAYKQINGWEPLDQSDPREFSVDEVLGQVWASPRQTSQEWAPGEFFSRYVF